MLVLGRKKDQSVLIGDDIEVKILDVDKHSGYVRVGVRAPKAINVVREEIIGRDRKEK